MDHSFNINVAKKLGIASAVILNNLYWWIDKNRANDKHFHDGYYWTYNSRKAFVEQFPYLTERQIEYALRKLIDGGYVITGNYNKASFDRTLWYAITKEGYCILQNCEMEETKVLNANKDPSEMEIPEPQNLVGSLILDLDREDQIKAIEGRLQLNKGNNNDSNNDSGAGATRVF